MAKFRAIGRMEAKMLKKGFCTDEFGNAQMLMGMKTPGSIYSDVRGYVSPETRGVCPKYIVLAEVRQGMEMWKHGRKIAVPPEGVMVLYETFGTHLEGFFGRNEEPLEDEAQRLRYLF